MSEKDHNSAFQKAAHWITRTTRGAVAGIGIGLGLVGGALVLHATHETRQLNKTMRFVVTSPAMKPMTNLSFGPFTEAAEGQTRVSLALMPAPNNQTAAYAMLSTMGSSHYAITRNAVVMDGQMVACRMEPQNCSPALKQFQQFIDAARGVNDPIMRAQVVNAWVNTAIAYDDDFVLAQKKAREKRPSPTLVETLENGKGICDQQAQLKLYALSRSGTAQEDLRYVALMVIKEGKWVESHAVVLARLNGKTFVLNGQQFDRDFPDRKQAGDDQRLSYNSALLEPRSFLNIDYDAPFRQGGTSLMPLYSANYVTAQPYQGMLDGAHPPYYHGQPFARHLLQPRVSAAPAKQAASITPAAIDALANALIFQDSFAMQPLVLPTMTIRAAAEPTVPQRREHRNSRDQAPEF